MISYLVCKCGYNYMIIRALVWHGSNDHMICIKNDASELGKKSIVCISNTPHKNLLTCDFINFISSSLLTTYLDVGTS